MNDKKIIYKRVLGKKPNKDGPEMGYLHIPITSDIKPGDYVKIEKMTE